MKFKVGQRVIAVKYSTCAEVFKEASGVILKTNYAPQFPYFVQTAGLYDLFRESELRGITCENCPEYLKKYEI